MGSVKESVDSVKEGVPEEKIRRHVLAAHKCRSLSIGSDMSQDAQEDLLRQQDQLLRYISHELEQSGSVYATMSSTYQSVIDEGGESVLCHILFRAIMEGLTGAVSRGLERRAAASNDASADEDRSAATPSSAPEEATPAAEP